MIRRYKIIKFFLRNLHIGLKPKEDKNGKENDILCSSHVIFKTCLMIAENCWRWMSHETALRIRHSYNQGWS